MNRKLYENAFNSVLMDIYKKIYQETKNEGISKNEVSKILSPLLDRFGIENDIVITIKVLTEEYKRSTDKNVKEQILAKLKVLNKALEIVESTFDRRSE